MVGAFLHLAGVGQVGGRHSVGVAVVVGDAKVGLFMASVLVWLVAVSGVVSGGVCQCGAVALGSVLAVCSARAPGHHARGEGEEDSYDDDEGEDTLYFSSVRGKR